MEDELRPQVSGSTSKPPDPKVASTGCQVMPRVGREAERRPREEQSAPWSGFNIGFLGWGDSDGTSQTETLVHELQNRIQDAEEYIHELQSELREARSQVKETLGTMRAEQAKNRGLRRIVRSMESERDIVNLNIQKQEAQIRQVQVLAFEGFGNDSWAAGDDGTVRADLENLHCRLKSWAKKHAVGEMSSVEKLDDDERCAFIHMLAHIAQPRAGVENPLKHLESPSMNKRSPAMCLQGLLAHHVYAAVISQPFFAFGDARKALEGICNTIEHVNEPESHIWRSKTLRLLATPPPNMKQGAGAQSCYAMAQKSVCYDVASEFYNSRAKHLMKPATRGGENTDTQCFDELESIVQHAGELSHRLWSRRTLLSVLSLPELEDQRFGPRSEILKAHPLHRLYEDDDRCDGWSVGVVAHPAVIGYGSSDGKDYSTGRVWMKAEVWLAEDV